MLTEADIIKRHPIDEYAKRKAMKKSLSPGIMHKVCDIVDVREGLLEPHPDFHPSQMFHKKVDRFKEVIVLRIISLVAPDIFVPFGADEGTRIENAWHEGFYMRLIQGKVIQFRRRFNAQQKFDIGCIGVIDALVANGDRHSYNAMVTKNHVYPIDHGNTFYGTLQERIPSLVYTVGMADRDYEAGVRYALDRVLTHADQIAGLMHEVRDTKTADVVKWANDRIKGLDKERKRALQERKAIREGNRRW